LLKYIELLENSYKENSKLRASIDSIGIENELIRSAIQRGDTTNSNSVENMRKRMEDGEALMKQIGAAQTTLKSHPRSNMEQRLRDDGKDSYQALLSSRIGKVDSQLNGAFDGASSANSMDSTAMMFDVVRSSINRSLSERQL